MDTKPYHWNTARIVGRIIERVPDIEILIRVPRKDGSATRPIMCYLDFPDFPGPDDPPERIIIQGCPRDPDQPLADVDDAPVDLVEITNALSSPEGFDPEWGGTGSGLHELYQELVRIFQEDGAPVVGDIGPFLPEVRARADRG